MKKIVSLLLAVLMLATMIPLTALPAFAEDSLCETFTPNNSKTIEGKIFKLSAYFANGTGWYAGGSSDWIKIEAKDSQNVIIDRVEARIHNGSNLFRELSISSGDITKYPEFYSDYGVVSNINNSSFKFSGGNGSVLIDEIKVYYHSNTSPTGSTLSQGNIWIIAGIAIIAIGAMAIVIKKKKIIAE